MKKCQPSTSSNGFEWKEPKLEEPFEETDFESHYGFSLDKIPKEEPIDEKGNFDDFLIQDKDQSLFDFDERVVKEEQDDFSDVPTTSTSKVPSSVPMWKPKFQSFADLMAPDDEMDDFHLDMTLGSSMLFDLPAPIANVSTTRTHSREEDDPSDDDEDQEDQDCVAPEKRILPPTKLREALNNSFAENCHPTAMEMQLLAEELCIRYKTVYDHFDTRRRTKRIKCSEEDPCERIKLFFARDDEPVVFRKIMDDVNAVLEEEIQKILTAKKKFGIGYVHAIMEKTDLSPAIIRGQYEAWKRKLMSNEREDYLIKDWKRDTEDQNNPLSLEHLKQLEEAYLHKKYHSEEKEWSLKEIRSLAAQIDLNEAKVQKWLDKRNGAVEDLQNDYFESELLAKKPKRKLPVKAVTGLLIEFEKNPRPTLAERVRIAKNLGLVEMQVRNYFNKKRMSGRKAEEWEKARQEFLTLPPKTITSLEKLASERRRSAQENMNIAQKLGVSYQTLCSFIDWRKSLNNAKHAYNKL